jgi:ParB family chromosome partitioning protein
MGKRAGVAEIELPDLPDLGQATPAGKPEGKAMDLPLDAIDEDPDQPRTEFDAEALQELTDSIL